jgi:hypothetical protein
MPGMFSAGRSAPEAPAIVILRRENFSAGSVHNSRHTGPSDSSVHREGIADSATRAALIP